MSPLSTTAIPTDPPNARRGVVLRRVLTNPLGVIGVSLLTVIVFAAVFAPLLAPYNPLATDAAQVLAPPSAEHLLGTDSAGRDVFSRLLYGAQVTLLAALVCAVVAIGVGLPAGLVAGYYGGALDSIPSWVANLIMSLPAIIVLLAVRAALGPTVWVSMAVFGIILSPGFYRLTRSAVRAVRNDLYVDAARVSGLGDARIISRHILYVVRAPIIIQTALTLGLAISIQSGLDFIGLGEPGAATWGGMLNEGFRNIYLSPWLIVWPAVAIGLTIGSFVLIGNAVRDALEDAPAVERRRARRAERAVQRARSGAQHTTPSVEERDLGSAETAPSDTRLLEVDRLSIGYAQPGGAMKTVVEDVSLHVDRGEVVGVVGESGSGKSQTAFAILGLLHDSARILNGSITIEGVRTVEPGATAVDSARIRSIRGRRIAYIPQEPMSNLDPMYTVGHQLTRPLVKVLGLSRREARERVLRLLAEVGIVDPERTFRAYPFEISGGMAQRVLIAAAVAAEPDLIIADEPTTALDVTVQAEILDLLRDLQSDRNLAILIVTHNFGVVADLADRVVVMSEGRVVESGPVRRVLGEPAEPYTRRLLGSMLSDKEPLTMIGEGNGAR
jgi:ABC-type dipeptide/oligopeptide/nickel transport system ATPase component/ABC-type dipeptide/oligopeptide/nickel transport system permease subunit